MSSAEDDAERLFPPTPRRREEARRSGRVAHSRLLVSALVVLATMSALRWGGEWLWGGVRAAAERPWSDGAWIRAADTQPLQQTRELLAVAGSAVAPWLLLVIAVAILANVTQFGLLFRPERLAERWETLLGPPAFGFGRRFREALFAIAQVSVVAGVAFWRLEPLLRGVLVVAPPSHSPYDNAPHDNAPHGNALHGNALHGNALHGNALHGNALHGNAPDGNAPDGNALDGNAADGHALYGDAATTTLAAGLDGVAAWGETVAEAVLETGVYASGLLVVIGLIDYGWSWWRLERSLWMTTEELREEMRSDSARHRPRRNAA